MAKKKVEIVEEIQENIHNETMETIMDSRFASYAKYVIQDRAIPDARDGLKPVQRRIIYAMYKDGNIFTRPTRKCAHTVGAVMGKYHPHGDTSIYEALVRMSQDWKNNNPLISFQGNNGSIDNDPAAAYRYTEARLSQIAEEMIRDLDKDTVEMALTFDDTEFEPVVMPSRFPNLLVNGTEGIAVGIATEIPTHNLREVVDAIIYRINHVRVEPQDLLQFIKGPDFPTGGQIYKSKGLDDIYLIGKGRIEVGAKTELIVTGKQKQIIVTEIPYKVVKIELVHELDKLRHDNVVSGIEEVRDESDRHGLRIAIDLKEEANAEVIYKYLTTKTSLRTGYSANMVSIVNGRPVTMNILDYVDCYINHQVDVITRRSTFDLKKSQSRLNIVDGLIKAISIVDKVVETIRKSKDKQDAKINIQNAFGFNEAQSEAIVMLQLYKLSNTDITTFMNEKKSLEDTIEFLNGILSDRKKLDRLLISDLKEIANKYGNDRKTLIVEKEENNAVIDKRDLISKEETYIAVSRDGYIKRSTPKSYRSSGVNPLPGLKEGDAAVYTGVATTTDYLICFTNIGNFLYIPVHEIMENKWKDEGKHINYLINLNPNEKIVKAFTIEEFRSDLFFVLVTKKGQIKRLRLSDFSVIRYSKPIVCIKLLPDDELFTVVFTTGNDNIYLFTTDGLSCAFNENELMPAGMRGGGVKGLTTNKCYVSGMLAYPQNEAGKAVVITNKACIRIYDVDKTEVSKRLGKKSVVVRSFKNDVHDVVYVKAIENTNEPMLIRFLTNEKQMFELTVDDFHQTPVDKYAKESITIAKKIRLNVPFLEGTDHISKDVESHEIVSETTPQEPIENSEVEQNPIDNDKPEEEKGYTQISIFDEDLD